MTYPFSTYLSLKETTDENVILYKDFVVTTEFATGPRGEWHEFTVWGMIDDPAEFDFIECRLEPLEEGVGEYETEGEALAAAFHLIESQFIPQKEAMK